MHEINTTTISIGACVFIVAALYSSVGHGGASGYLAIMSFMGVAPDQMATTALLLNLLVSSLSFLSYFRAGHFSWRLTWPFIAGSVPAAFAGGLIHVSGRWYYVILAAVLVFAAYRLCLASSSTTGESPSRPLSTRAAAAFGGLIGLLSGVVGVGGGIFLSPLMLLMNWADAKKTSASSALFILVNSLAGLGGRRLRGGLDAGLLAPFVAAAFLGGLIGSQVGARKLTGLALRRTLAAVLVVAAAKLVITSF